MSRENIETVRRATEAYLRDPEALLNYAHPDIELVEDPNGPAGAVTHRGPTAVKRFHEVARTYWEEGWRLEPEQFVDRGDEVLLLAHLFVRSLRGGPEIRHSFCVLHAVRDGKIVRVRWFSNPQDALEAAGLRE